MLATKLIVIDGLSGSGKTTTAEWLTHQLKRRGIKNRYLPEYNTAHPLWWYEYWDGRDYLTPDFDNIPIERFIENSLARWSTFAESIDESIGLVLAESVFFQDAVAMFLMGDATPARLFAYAREVQQIAQGLNPVLIYFRQNDVAHALRRICTIRGADFEQELLTNMERFPYMKHRNLKGLDGLTVLWEDIHKLTDTIFEEYEILKLAIKTSGENWPKYQEQILEFLQLSP